MDICVCVRKKKKFINPFLLIYVCKKQKKKKRKKWVEKMEEIKISENEKNEILNKLNNPMGFIVKNNNYEIIWQPYNDFFAFKGWSILDLIRERNLPFSYKFEITEIGPDYITFRIPGHEKFRLVVFARKDLETGNLIIFPHVMLVSP